VKKTRQVYEQLQSSYSRLWAAMRDGQVRTPAVRDCSGDFLWSDEEVEAARQALSVDRRRKVPL
jgi:hypothetical protein